MITLDKEMFEAEVLNKEGLVVVDYWSESCEPCKALMPEIEALSGQFGDDVSFYKLDVVAARRLALSQRVLGVPTVSLYRNGEKIAEVTKENANKNAVMEMIEKAIEPK